MNFRTALIALFVAFIIWGPSNFFSWYAKRDADVRFGSGNYCWIIRDSSPYSESMLVSPLGDIDVSFWSDLVGAGEDPYTTRPHFGVLDLKAGSQRQDVFGWSYSTFEFYSSYSLSFFVQPEHFNRCAEVLEGEE